MKRLEFVRKWIKRFGQRLSLKASDWEKNNERELYSADVQAIVDGLGWCCIYFLSTKNGSSWIILQMEQITALGTVYQGKCGI